MLPAWRRIRLGAIALGACFIVAVIGYRLWGEYGWIEAAWLVTMAISTVGFSEHSGLSSGLQLFTMLVILFGVTAAAYTFGAFVQLAIEGHVEQLLGRRKMTREIRDLSRHAIICGYGRMGEKLAETLTSIGIPFVVIDRDNDRAEHAKNLGYLVLQGDASEEATLTSAGIQRAASLLTCFRNDAENVFITLTARNLSPSIQIVARADQTATEKKLIQAGATRVVLPSVSGARLMARMVSRPTTADFVELVSSSSYPGMDLDELLVTEKSKLAGSSVKSTEAHRKHKLLVVAILRPEGDMMFNPDAEYCFRVGDTVIIMGRDEDIGRFQQEFV